MFGASVFLSPLNRLAAVFATAEHMQRSLAVCQGEFASAARTCNFFPDGMFETSQTLYVPLGVGWVSRDRVDPLGRERLSAPRRSPQYVIARIDKEGTGESTLLSPYKFKSRSAARHAIRRRIVQVA